jgi:hypothetical protein
MAATTTVTVGRHTVALWSLRHVLAVMPAVVSRLLTMPPMVVMVSVVVIGMATAATTATVTVVVLGITTATATATATLTLTLTVAMEMATAATSTSMTRTWNCRTRPAAPLPRRACRLRRLPALALVVRATRASPLRCGVPSQPSHRRRTAAVVARRLLQLRMALLMAVRGTGPTLSSRRPCRGRQRLRDVTMID